VALLVLGLAACALAAASMLTSGCGQPIDPGHAATAAGAIVTTIVLIFLDTSRARIGASIGLVAGIAVLIGGLLMSGGTAPPRAPTPGFYPDPRAEARLRYWDGAGWSERTRD